MYANKNSHLANTDLVWIAKTIIFGSLLANGLLRLTFTFAFLNDKYIFYKDFLQEYVLAKAIKAGVQPYAPLPELVSHFFGKISVPILPHPTPHPPCIALLFYPFAWVSYSTAVRIWYVIEIGMLVAVAYLLIRWASRSLNPKSWLLPIYLISWQPFMNDLIYAQLSLLILLLLLFAGVLFRKDKPIYAGAILGISIALKIFTWPFLLWLLLRRQWKAFFSAGSVIAFLNFSAIMVMGWNTVINYYEMIASQTAVYYRSFPYNYSISTLSWRAFAGTGSEVLVSFTTLPLIKAEIIAPAISLALIIAVLVLASYSSFLKNMECGLAAISCACILCSPVAWAHYLVLMCIPFAWLYSRLLPPLKYLSWALVTALWFLTDQNLEKIALWLGGKELVAGQMCIIPFWAGAITFLPIVCILSIMILVIFVGFHERVKL